MAKIKGPLFSQSAAGPFAGAIGYASATGQHVARSLHGLKAAARRSTPSAAQLGHRAAYQAAAAFWRTLSPEDRAAYAATAAPLFLTGFNLFMRSALNGAIDITPDIPPVFADAAYSVAENAAPGTLIATLAATDADGDPIAYAITAGNALDAFALDSNTGELTVASAAPLDYETRTSIILTVEATAAGAAVAAAITINITDLQDTGLADTFTGANGAQLNTHAADSGHTWTRYTKSGANGTDETGVATIQANQLQFPLSQPWAAYYSSWVPPSPNYTVTANHILTSLGDAYMTILGRLDPNAATFYGITRKGDAIGTLYLYKHVAGVETVLSTTTSANVAGQNRLIELVLNGTTVIAKVNGVAQATITDTSIAAAGRVGVRGISGTDGATLRTRVDNFTAQ